MSPQQRLLLGYTYLALHDAGCTQSPLEGSNAGVFIGSSGSTHYANGPCARRLNDPCARGGIDCCALARMTSACARR